MARRLFQALSAVLLALVLVPAHATVVTSGKYTTRADAYSACMAYRATVLATYPTMVCVYTHGYPIAGDDAYKLSPEVAGPWYWPTTAPDNGTDPAAPPPTCTAGQVVPSGTQVKFYPSANPVGPNDGTTCNNGCQVVLNINIGATGAVGGYAQSGAVCPSSSATPTTPTLSPPDETTNPDGGKTYCIHGTTTCVTTHPDTSPPAPATSSPNDTTSSNTTTNTPASTSSSSGTTTGGTDGTSTGTGGTGTWTGQTSTPASSSSSQTQCTTGVCDVGNADGDLGGLYEAGTDSPASAYAGFKAAVSKSPLISATTGFFAVSVSGACPSWHIPGNKYWGAAGFDFTFFCDPAILAIMAAAGWIVLAMGAFCAFRIAFY